MSRTWLCHQISRSFLPPERLVVAIRWTFSDLAGIAAPYTWDKTVPARLVRWSRRLRFCAAESPGDRTSGRRLHGTGSLLTRLGRRPGRPLRSHPFMSLPSVFRRDEGDTGRPFSSAVFLDHGILPLPPAAPRSLALAGSQGGSASLRAGRRCPRIEISSAPSPSFPPDSGIPSRPSMRAGRPRSRDSASGRRYARARVVPVRCPGAAEVTMPTDRPSCQTVWL